MYDNTNAYFRLSELLALITSDRFNDDEKLNINVLSELTGIPASNLRLDLLSMLQNSILKDFFLVEDNTGLDERNDEMLSKWLVALTLNEKKAYETAFHIKAEGFWDVYSDEYLAVNLSAFEKNILAKQLHTSEISDAIWIKDAPFTNDPVAVDNRKTIQTAIDCQNPISFFYNDPAQPGQASHFNCRCIYETIENRRLYGIDFDDNGKILFRRLDYMSDLVVHDDEAMPPFDESLLDTLDYIWDADASSDEITNVKVRIYNNTTNIIEKIRTETNCRAKTRKLYPSEDGDDIYYYEDKVCGLNSFKKWVRKYGASMVVLEPVSLAREMYESVLRRLENYERGIIT